MRLGPWAEQLAVRHLQKLGYSIVASNYRNRFGEIDIIARHEGCTVFVEVKARRSFRYGPPKAAVGLLKQMRLRKMAAMWISQQSNPDQACRFDVVSVLLTPDGVIETIEVLPHAF